MKCIYCGEDCYGECDGCNEDLLLETEAEKGAKNEALKKLCELVNLTPEIANPILSKVADEASRRLEDHLMKQLKVLIEKACGDQIKVMAKAHMEKTFLEVISSSIVIANSGWREKKVQIKDVIKEELDSKIKSMYGKDEVSRIATKAVEDLLRKDIDNIAKQSVQDFKNDISDQINKEAMQNITKAIAGAIGSDNKLLAILKS